MTDERVTVAVDFVARDIIWKMVENGLDNDGWEIYGDQIGEYDWQRIEQRIRKIISDLEGAPQQTVAAYEYLEGRISSEEPIV